MMTEFRPGPFLLVSLVTCPVIFFFGFGFVAFTVKPNSQARNSSTFGVLSLTLAPASYSWQFVPTTAGGFSDSGSASCH